MPRARVSPANQQLGLEFALMVTTHSADTSFVVRRGPNSIYFALAQCAPSVIRDQHVGANCKGISEAELLRALGDSGKFTAFRDRRAVRMSDDPTGAGMCIFKNLRWRDPTDSSDLAYLHEQHEHLTKAFPAYAAETSVQKLCSILKAIVAAWEWCNAKHCTSPCRRASDASVANTVFDTSCPVSSPQSDEYSDTAPVTGKRHHEDDREGERRRDPLRKNRGDDQVSSRIAIKARTVGTSPVQQLIQANSEHARDCAPYYYLGDCDVDFVDVCGTLLQPDPLCMLREMSPMFNESYGSLLGNV